MILWEYPLRLAVVAEAGRDLFQKHFACVGKGQHPEVIIAFRAILLHTKDFDSRIVLLLVAAPRAQHIDK